MEIKGIKYTGPVFDGSGYAQAVRGNIMALYSLGVPLTVNSISFEQLRPDLGEIGKTINKMVNKKIDYNVNIIHTTPEFWSRHKEEGKLNIGYSIWETTLLHPKWESYINDNVDAVMVGCEWNVKVFRDSGVTVPIFVVPHGISASAFDNIGPYHIQGIKEDAYVFYSIFQWCYDDKTRVLTKAGFKYFKDLSYEDEIATLNKETEELEYHKPDKIVSFYRKDKMSQLTGSQFDVCVTPDHKMVVKECIGNSCKIDVEKPWQLKPLNEMVVNKRKSDGRMVSSRYRTKKNCIWNGEEVNTFIIPTPEGYNYNSNKLPSVVKMDDFLNFLGWYLSEGSVEISDNYYRVAITQVKSEENIKEIMKCIFDMGFKPFIHNNKDVLFNGRDLCLYLKKFGYHYEKFVPEFVKNLSARQIRIFLTSLFKGDGSIYDNGNWVKYVTTSKRLAEDVQECLLKVGMSGSVSISDPSTKKPGYIDGRLIQGKKLQHTVSVNRERNEPVMCYAKFEEVDYDGYVYCATVKNHTMLVERNGKVLFSGNTERKHPLALIKGYWHAFQDNEDVALVLKTYRSDYSDQEKDAIRTTIKRLKTVTPMDVYPPIYLIPNMLTDNEILGLHARGDCYVSLDRGEGFGLSPFAAGACGNPIMVTGFGGTTEYAKEHNSYLVNYTLTPVFGMPWSGSPMISISCVNKYKKIKDMREGDLVFNKNGNIKRVLKVGDRPMLSDERMHSIKHVSMHTNIEVTNKHKLYIVKDNKAVLAKAENITDNDYLVLPKPKLFSEDFSIDMKDYVLNDVWSEENGRIVYNRDADNSDGIYRKIELSEDFFYLIGLYLAEGCVYNSNDCVSFSFNSTEKDTLGIKCKTCLSSVFGIDASHFYERVYEDRAGYEIIVNNTLIGRFFKTEFNTGSKDKFMPYRWRLNSNKGYREHLLKGYWDGDGHISYRHRSQKAPEYSSTTVSEGLVLSMRDLIISLDVIPSLTVNVRTDGRVSYIISVTSEIFDTIFDIKCRRNERNSYYYKMDDNHFAVRVKSNSIIEDYKEPVYSMAVEPDDNEDIEHGGSYILNGIASSNSPWYRGDQLWAEPDIKHGADTMKYIYENQDKAKLTGERLREDIRKGFSWEAVGRRIINGIKEL